MKRTLLLTSILVLSFGIFAQVSKEWNFSNAPYGATPTVTFTSTFTNDLLTVGTDGTAQWALDANTKTLNGVEYTHRLKSGGGGAPTAGSFIPTTRYLSFRVSGASTIDFGMMSSSSSASRILIITNADETVKDSIQNIIGTAIGSYTYNYTGPASTLYFYSRSSGINFYVIKATNVVITQLKDVFTDKGIFFNGQQISNSNNLPLEVYNVLGELMVKSTGSVNTDDFQKGVYVVRAESIQGALKFSK